MLIARSLRRLRKKPNLPEEAPKPVIHFRAREYANVGSGGQREVTLGGDTSTLMGGLSGNKLLGFRKMTEPYRNAVPEFQDEATSNPLRKAGRLVRNVLYGADSVLRVASESPKKFQAGSSETVTDEAIGRLKPEHFAGPRSTGDTAHQSSEDDPRAPPRAHASAPSPRATASGSRPRAVGSDGSFSVAAMRAMRASESAPGSPSSSHKDAFDAPVSRGARADDVSANYDYSRGSPYRVPSKPGAKGRLSSLRSPV